MNILRNTFLFRFYQRFRIRTKILHKGCDKTVGGGIPQAVKENCAFRWIIDFKRLFNLC